MISKKLKPSTCRTMLFQVKHLVILSLSSVMMVGTHLGFPLLAEAQIPSQLQNRNDPQRNASSSATLVPTYQETPYVLGPGDTINISIFNVPEYSGSYPVLVDGTVNLPIVGTIEVQGLTIPQANELISRRYNPILQRPIVTVSLVQPRPVRIAIAGEVNRPGSYTLSFGSGTSSNRSETQQFPPITQAIQQAGGITRSADVRQVKLRRVLNEKAFVLNVNLWRLVEEGEIVQDVTLRDGDTIFVPTVTENDAQETRLLAQSAIAPVSQAVEVAVVGEVNRPGSHRVTGGDGGTPPTVTQAIQAAGGITNLSDIRQIEVERTTRTGTQKILSANLWELLQQGDVKQDVILQPGDTVIVPRATEVNPTEAEALAQASFSPQTIRVNLIGEAEQTGTLELPANTPLNQAILSAGGFNNRADKGEVQLVRLNPNGTVTRREIEIDLNAGIDPQNNPTLRNNDVIVVEKSTFAAVSDTVGTIFQPFTTIFQGIRFFDIIFGND